MPDQPNLTITRVSSPTPVPSHAGMRRSITWTLSINGTAIKEINERQPWARDESKFEDPIELVQLRDAIRAAIPVAPSGHAQSLRTPVAFRFKKANDTYSYVESIDAEEDRFKHFWEPLFLTAPAVDEAPVAWRIGHSGGGYHYADTKSPPHEPEKWIALYPESSLFDEPASRASCEASQHRSGELEPGSSEAIKLADRIDAWSPGKNVLVFIARERRMISEALRSAASTVEPVAWRWRGFAPLSGSNGELEWVYSDQKPDADHGAQALYAAPTTSPEPEGDDECPDCVGTGAEESYNAYHIDGGFQTCRTCNGSGASRRAASPEPDAVRVEIARIIDPDAWDYDDDQTSPTEREIIFERRHGKQIEALHKADQITALSRPAQGDVKAFREITCEKLQDLRTLWATDFKTPENQGQRGADRTDALYEAIMLVKKLPLARNDRGGCCVMMGHTKTATINKRRPMTANTRSVLERLTTRSAVHARELDQSEQNAMRALCDRGYATWHIDSRTFSATDAGRAALTGKDGQGGAT